MSLGGYGKLLVTASCPARIIPARFGLAYLLLASVDSVACLIVHGLPRSN